MQILSVTNPNPIRSDSFEFRNNNFYFGSDRIGKVVLKSDRFGLYVDYQIQNVVNLFFMIKLDISRRQFVTLIASYNTPLASIFNADVLYPIEL